MKRLLLFFIVLGFLLSGCTHKRQPTVDARAELDALVAQRPAVVSFFATWCSFCQKELPELSVIAGDYPNVAFVGVNLQEEAETVSAFWNGLALRFPYMLDPDAVLKQEYRVITQPTILFIDAGGTVVGRTDGPASEEVVRQEIDKLLNERIIPIEMDDEDEAVDSESSAIPSLLKDWYTGRVQHVIPLDEILSGGPPKDGIPALSDPAFVSVADAMYIDDDDPGVLIQRDKDIRFYPFSILIWHEIINDTVDGEPIAITYCPLCETAVVYGRNISAGVVEFGVSGLLYRNNLLMYDRSTESLWSQIEGKAVVGELAGEELELLGSNIVRFSIVKEQYPTAMVLSRETGYVRDY